MRRAVRLVIFDFQKEKTGFLASRLHHLRHLRRKIVIKDAPPTATQGTATGTTQKGILRLLSFLTSVGAWVASGCSSGAEEGAGSGVALGSGSAVGAGVAVGSAAGVGLGVGFVLGAGVLRTVVLDIGAVVEAGAEVDTGAAVASVLGV